MKKIKRKWGQSLFISHCEHQRSDRSDRRKSLWGNLISFCLIFLISFLLLSLSYAGIFKTPGTAGVPFLKINLGARPQSLSESFCGLADDINSVNFNPAGIAQIQNTELQFTHLMWYEDVTAQSISFGKSITKNSKNFLALNCIMLQGEDNVRELATIIENGEEEVIIKTGEKINLKDIAVGLTYAGRIPVGLYADKNVCLGITAKYISEKLYKTQNSAYAFDAGLLYGPDKDNNFYGIAIQNVGSDIGKDVLPTNLRIGASHKEEGYLMSFEGSKGIDSRWRISLGIEVLMGNAINLRGGCFYQQSFSYTFGLGINIKPVSIDYAYAPHIELNTTHRISLVMKFGKNEESELESEEQPPPKQKTIRKLAKRKLPGKTTLAVADFSAKEVPAMVASTVSDFIRSDLVNTGAFYVMDRENMEAILAEQKFQSSGCTTEKCAVKMGKLLNVQQIVVGSLSKLESTYYITANLVDITTGRILKSYTEKAINADEFREACKIIAHKLSN